MTVDELIQQLVKIPGDAEVVLSKDPEGNKYWSLDEVEFAKGIGDNDWCVFWPGGDSAYGEEPSDEDDW